MQKIAIIGGGTMGAGIAQASALAGYEVVLYDVTDALLAQSVAGIVASIDKGVARGKTPAADAETAAWFETAASLEPAR